MRRCVLLAAAVLLGPGALCAADGPASSQNDEKVLVAVAPFPSNDGGKWGRAVADAFRAKLSRWPGTTVIDRFTMDDMLESEKLAIAWDTPVARLARFADKTLGAKIFIYGDAAVAGAKGDEVTLRVRAIDLRAGPVLAVDRAFQLSYPTQLRPAVEIVLNQLVGYSTINMEVPALVKITPEMEKRWREGANLVPNGDFSAADARDKDRLARWEVVIGDKRYAPPRFDGSTAPLVADFLRHGLWADDPADANNRVLHMPVSEEVAATYGVACYSDWIRIEPGNIYRFAYRWRVEGPTPKVFIKGYALRPTPGESDAGRKINWQRREVYRRQIHPTSEADPKRDLGNGWTETTADFCPRHDQTPPHWVRIDIYAYWPKGRAWFDDVVLKKLSDRPVVEQADPPGLPKDEGPSAKDEQ